MYMTGMGRYRGLGQGQCPGDPGCNNPMIANPLTPDQIAALSAANAAYFNQPTILAPSSQTLTQWLNANSTAVMIGAGVLLALAVLK